MLNKLASQRNEIPFVWWRCPNTAALIPSKISPDHKENLAHFKHSAARSKSAKCSSSPRACLYSRLWAKKKKVLCKLFLHTNTQAVQLQSSLSLQMTASPNGSQRHRRVRAPGVERGLGSGGWVVWAVWIHGWMDTWMWREKNAWMDSAKRNDNGTRGQSLPHMQEMSTWGAGLNTTPSGRQLPGMCLSSQVRS